MNRTSPSPARRKTSRPKTKLKGRANALTDAQFDEVFFQYQAMVAKRATLEAVVNSPRPSGRDRADGENMFIRAPFDGTVISKDAEVGESILPGGMGDASGRGSVVTIADLDHLEVDCDVKEDYIARVQVGPAAEVAVDAVPEPPLPGPRPESHPDGRPGPATIKVKVEILDVDERLFPEMSSTVYFLPRSDGEKPADEAAINAKRIFCDSGHRRERVQSELRVGRGRRHAG